jgi:N-acetylglucosamine-6-phosphate deacetylase
MGTTRVIRGCLEPGGPARDLQVTHGRIAAILPPADSPAADLTGDATCIVAEAFLDIQVNGFAGVDFNRAEIHCGELRRAAEAMWVHGVTRFFPTVITAPLDAMTRTLAAVRHAREGDPVLARAIPGIQVGVVVAIGHTDAAEADIDAAVSAGAQLSSHLGNGAHAVLPRHRNYIQKQLATDGLLASIIADGHHLTTYFVQNVVRCKGPDRVVLITDAMAAAAAPPGVYRLGEVLAEAQPDGAVRLPGTPYLAGSALTMDRAVDNVRRFAGIPLARALTMAARQPRLLWPDLPGGLVVGATADIVLLRDGDPLEVLETIVAGETVFRAPRR